MAILSDNKALVVYNLLIETYGELELKPRRDPMHELISTMLSHRTTEANEALAYQRMWERFGSWEAIRDAPVVQLTEAITPATFPESKAPNIQKTLTKIIAERGEANLEFLRDQPTEPAFEWLTDLPGVGIKTATLVLLFCFSKPVIPVDTHVHRVSGRLGLISAKVSAEAAHHRLLEMLPPEPHVLYNFHVAMLRHGQRICTFNNPKCNQCPLRNLCDYYLKASVSQDTR
jgi:endonuclease-3